MQTLSDQKLHLPQKSGPELGQETKRNGSPDEQKIQNQSKVIKKLLRQKLCVNF